MASAWHVHDALGPVFLVVTREEPVPALGSDRVPDAHKVRDGDVVGRAMGGVFLAESRRLCVARGVVLRRLPVPVENLNGLLGDRIEVLSSTLHILTAAGESIPTALDSRERVNFSGDDSDDRDCL